MLQFFPPGTIRVPIVRGPFGSSKPRITSFSTPWPSCTIATSKGDLNRARDYGAKLVRSLVGLLETQYNFVVASQPSVGGRNRHQRTETEPQFMASGSGDVRRQASRRESFV